MKSVILLTSIVLAIWPCVLSTQPDTAHKQVSLSAAKGNATKKHVNIPMPKLNNTNHQKEAGGGYLPGSPMYAKQEERKAMMPDTTTLPSAFVPTAAPTTSTWTKIKKFLVGEFIYILFVLLAAAIYRHFKAHGERMVPLGGKANVTQFTYGLLDFKDAGRDWKICLSGFLCPCFRWAETMRMMGRDGLGYWPCIALYIILHLLFVPSGGIALIITSYIGMTYRRKLRAKQGYKTDTGPGPCLDFCTWWCCGPCAVIQEAREVENVRNQQGY